MTTVLGYIPFLTPMNALLDWTFLLVVPLAFGISVIYKAMRLRDLTLFWRDVAVMTFQIILGMVALSIALIIVVRLMIPALPVT